MNVTNAELAVAQEAEKYAQQISTVEFADIQLAGQCLGLANEIFG